MVVAREEYAALIARAFDGAVMVDGARVIAHKSGMHVVRDRGERRVNEERRPLDRPPQRERVAARPGGTGPCDRENDWSDV